MTDTIIIENSDNYPVEVTVGLINEPGGGPAWSVWESEYPEEGCVGYFDHQPTLEEAQAICPEYVIAHIRGTSANV